MNPETPITRSIREILRILRIPHFKHFGGPMSEPGVSDLVGTIPGSGRALYIEVKVPGKEPRPEQRDFLQRHKDAGALAFWATSANDVVRRLAEEGYEPAKRIGLT